ncbi:MAG TPA: ATP:cob(I)alamin adenosyltransferase, partial [Coriobacteriia bacterium]
MGIYTRRGDAGETALADGSRTSKASPRVEAYGSVDEAAAAVGFARQVATDATLDATLRFAQQRLLNCSSTLADPRAGGSPVAQADIVFLEAAIDRLSDASGGWSGFVLASGGEL